MSWPSKTHRPYICDNCGVAWRRTPELWPCAADGCQRTLCDDCRAKCFFCDRDFCQDHLPRVDFGDGDGMQNCCAECSAEWHRERESSGYPLGLSDAGDDYEYHGRRDR